MSTIAEITKTMQGKMDQSIAAFKASLVKIRTGRPSPGLFDTVHVEYYGSNVPISQVANVSVLDNRTLSVQPWEKGMAAKIEKAIRDSDLGVNPTNDGTIIRVVFPQLTEERRRDLVKMAKAKGEDAKVAIRNIRRRSKEELDRIARDGEAGEDEVRRAEKELDDLTAQHVHHIDEAVKNKESELLEV